MKRPHPKGTQPTPGAPLPEATSRVLPGKSPHSGPEPTIQGAVFPGILFQIPLDGVGKPCYTVTNTKKGWVFLMKKQTVNMNSAFYFTYYYFINSKRIK